MQLVGPAITWGTMPGFADPVVWLDAFYAAYRAANGNRDPRIDCLVVTQKHGEVRPTS